MYMGARESELNHEDTKIAKADLVLGESVATATASCANVFTRPTALRVLRSSWLAIRGLGFAIRACGYERERKPTVRRWRTAMAAKPMAP